MSSNSGDNPIEKIKPVPRSEPVIGPKIGKNALAFASLIQKRQRSESRFEGQVQVLPANVVSFSQDSSTMLGVLRLLGITSQTCFLIGSESATSAIPYLGLFSAPTYLYHFSSRVYDRFKIVADAIATKRVSDVFFWGAKTLDSVGDAIGTISKTSSSFLTILGFSTFATFGLVFTLIMPILLTVLGGIGGIAIACSLWKNAQAIKHYESLRDLSSTLEYLQGPKTRLEKEDIDTDKAVKERLLRLEKNNFESIHFSSDPRALYIKQKLDKIQSSIRTSREVVITKKDELRNVFASMKEVEEIFEKILTMKEGDEFKLIEDMHYLYDKLAANHDLNEDLRKMMDDNRKELRRVLALARKTTAEVGSDMHRVLAYNALFLFMTVIMISSSVLTLVAPEHAVISSYIGIGCALLEISLVLFDKNVDMKQFHELRKMINSS